MTVYILLAFLCTIYLLPSRMSWEDVFDIICVHHCKTSQSISLKLDVVIEPIDAKNRVTFGGDPVPDTDSGSLFHFCQYCRIGHFRRFRPISIFHIGRLVVSRLSRNSSKGLTQTLTRKWIHDIFGGIRRALESGSIRKSGFESWITFLWGNQNSGGALDVGGVCALGVFLAFLCYHMMMK